MTAKISTKKTPLIPQATPVLQDSIISRVNSDKTVSIVNLDLDDLCYSLDGIAAEIWTLIDGKTSLESIRKSMIKKHKPPLDIFDADFQKLIRKLKKENLIQY